MSWAEATEEKDWSTVNPVDAFCNKALGSRKCLSERCNSFD
jgi:hypothetical protein